MSRDILNELSVESQLAPLVITATKNVTGVGTAGYRSLAFLVNYGISADTLSGALYWTAKVQKATTLGGTYTDCGATELILGTATSTANAFGLINDPAEDDEVYMAGVKIDPDYDFYRVVLTPTGSITYGIPVGVIALRGIGEFPVTTNLATPA